jgi:phosphatidate cytidylyltransferase
MIFKDIKKRIATSLILFILIILIIKYNFILIFSLLILGIYSIIEFLDLTKKIFSKKINFLIINSIFIIYVFFFCFIFFFLTNFVQLKIIIFALLLSCVASDIGGFISGRIIKGPKLTKISPNKTISGAIGSIIFTCITFFSIIFYFSNYLNYKILIIGLITSIACQLGDLLFSFLKRKAKIKDTGKLFPGHGGVLDRLDGIFIGIPAGFISIVLLY